MAASSSQSIGTRDAAPSPGDFKTVTARSFFELVNKASASLQPALFTTESNPSERRKYLSQGLISLSQLQQSEAGKDAVDLAMRVHHYALKQAQLFHPGIERELEGSNRLAIPVELLSSITRFTLHMQSWSPKEHKLWLQQVFYQERVPEYDKLKKWVKKVNRSARNRTENREQSLAILRDLRRKAWNFSEGVSSTPKLIEIASIRKDLFTMYGCNDQQVKSQALEYLIELLECDPLEGPSAFGLLQLQHDLREELDRHQAQNLDTSIQRPLIKAYALTLANILLQVSFGNINGLTQETKDEIWTRTEEFAKLNIQEDDEIHFWSEFAVQAAQRLKTDRSMMEEWMQRFFNIAKAALIIGSTYNRPDVAIDAFLQAQELLSNALWHITWKKSWFEKTLTLIRLSRFSLHDVNNYRRIIPTIQSEKAKVQKPAKLLARGVKKIKETWSGDAPRHLMYGIVSTIYSSIARSPDPAVQEEGMKLLLQFATMDDERIQYRVVGAFEDLMTQPGKVGKTARMVIEILNVIPMLRSERANRLVAELTAAHPMEPLSREEAYGSHFSNVIKYLIYRVAEIKSLDEPGGATLVTVLAASEQHDIVKSLFKWIAKFTPDFQKADIYGRSAYHIAAEKKHLAVIKQIKDYLSPEIIDIDGKDYQHGRTALHQAVLSTFPDGVHALLQAGADPNIRCKKGLVPLHIAVEKRDLRLINHLLQGGANPNILTFDAESALDLAIANNDVAAMKAIMAKGGCTAMHPHITPITEAARRGAERCVAYLVEGLDRPLHHMEALHILLMISSNGRQIHCSPDFCSYFSSSISQHPLHKAVLERFPEWPGLERSEDSYQMSSLTDSAKVAAPSSKEISHFGNTRLMEYAADTRSTRRLRSKLKRLSTKKINESNYFGITALHVACLSHNPSAVRALIKAGANIDQTDNSGYTPLHFAALIKDVEILEILLKAGANPNLKDAYGHTPLVSYCSDSLRQLPQAVGSINTKVVARDTHNAAISLFADYEADFMTCDLLGNTALHKAASLNNEDLIIALCEIEPKLFWAQNDMGLIPFLDALRRKTLTNAGTFLATVEGGDLGKINVRFVEQTGNIWPLANCLAYAQEPTIFEMLVKDVPAVAGHPSSNPRHYTPLHVAALEGSVGILEVYKKEKLSLSRPDAFGNTAAHLAAMEGHDGFLKALPDDSPVFHMRNLDGRKALHLAAAQPNIEALKHLVKSPEAVADRDSRGETPLHHACRYGHCRHVKYLCMLNPESIFQINENGNTPLHIAAAMGHASCVNELLECKARWDRYKSLSLRSSDEPQPISEVTVLEAEDIQGDTALILAAQEGKIMTVRHLLAKEVGADFRKQDFEGETALHKAVFNLHYRVVQTLLNTECAAMSPSAEDRIYNLMDVRLETALLELCKNREKQKRDPIRAQIILRVLLEAGANLFHRNEAGQTFLHLAVQNGLVHLLSYLVRAPEVQKWAKGVNWNQSDSHGSTPMHYAALGEQSDSARFLIQQGADINATDEDGRTPLMVAVRHDGCEVAQVLLSRGARLKRRDNEGRTVLHHLLAKENGDLSHASIEFLRNVIQRYPEIIYMRDNEGYTPLHLLALNNHGAALDILLRGLYRDSVDRNERYVFKKVGDDTAYSMARDSGHHQLATRLFTYAKTDLGADGPAKKRGICR